MKLEITYREIAILFLILNVLFTIANPDPYLGIADYYIFFIGFFGLFVLSRIPIAFDNFLKHMFILLVYIFFEMINAGIRGVFSTGYILSYLIYIVFAILVINMNFNKKEVVKIINGYIFSGLLISIWLLVQRYEFYEGWSARHTVKFLFNGPIDPNFLGAFLVFPALLMFAKTLYSFSIKKVIACILIFTGILYTSSRGAAVSLFIGMIFVLFDFLKGNNKLLKILLIILATILAVFLISRFVPQSSLSRIFDFETYNDKSNAKRIVDWIYGINAFKESPLFGYGLQGESSIIQSTLGTSIIAHNTYVAFLLQFGVLGVLLLFAGFLKLLIKIRNNRVLIGCLASTLAVSFLVSAETAVFFWIPIIYITSIEKFESQSGEMYSWLQ